MQPLAALGLAPLATDLERVETELAATVRSDDRFLGEVAAHLVKAGGKRLRPALTLCTGYAAHGVGPATDDAITGAVAVELVHLGSLYHDDVIDEAETRRGRPERERALEQHRRDPRRRLPPRPRVGARGVARRPRRRAARGDDRRAVPRSGARAAAPLRRRPHRGDLLLRDRRQDRGAVRDRVPHRRDGGRGRRPDARRAHRVRPAPRRVLPDRRRRARRHRLATRRSASPPATTSSKACTRCR